MNQRPKVLAIASGGGHLTQLSRLLPAFADCDLTLATTERGFESIIGQKAREAGCDKIKFATVVEANRWQKIRLVRSLISVAWLVMRTRPDVIVTTGAAPGYFAIRAATLVGARTVWIDSIANAEAVSLSGEMAGKHSDLWLTQWAHLETDAGPKFEGSVI